MIFLPPDAKRTFVVWTGEAHAVLDGLLVTALEFAGKATPEQSNGAPQD